MQRTLRQCMRKCPAIQTILKNAVDDDQPREWLCLFSGDNLFLPLGGCTSTIRDSIHTYENHFTSTGVHASSL